MGNKKGPRHCVLDRSTEMGCSLYPLTDLRQAPSDAIAEAVSGRVVVITAFNQPQALIVRPQWMKLLSRLELGTLRAEDIRRLVQSLDGLGTEGTADMRKSALLAWAQTL